MSENFFLYFLLAVLWCHVLYIYAFKTFRVNFCVGCERVKTFFKKNISCKLDLLAADYRFCVSEKVFISPSVLKDTFVR